MASQENPATASSSRGPAMQFDVNFVLDEPVDKTTLVTPEAIDDPQGHCSFEIAPQHVLHSQNVPVVLLPDSLHVIQTVNSIDQEYEANFQMLEDQLKYNRNTNNDEDEIEDYNNTDNEEDEDEDVDEDDEVDETRSEIQVSDQNNSFLGTKATDILTRATLSDEPLPLNADISPTTTPNDILVPTLAESSIESLQKPTEVEEEGVPVNLDRTSWPEDQNSQNPIGTELVIPLAPNPVPDTVSMIQSEDGTGVNQVSEAHRTYEEPVHDDEVDGTTVDIQMNMVEQGGPNARYISTCATLNDTPPRANTDISLTAKNDFRVPRLAVPSLEPLQKRARVKEEGILVNVEHTSSPSSGARP